MPAELSLRKLLSCLFSVSSAGSFLMEFTIFPSRYLLVILMDLPTYLGSHCSCRQIFFVSLHRSILALAGILRRNGLDVNANGHRRTHIGISRSTARLLTSSGPPAPAQQAHQAHLVPRTSQHQARFVSLENVKRRDMISQNSNSTDKRERALPRSMKTFMHLFPNLHLHSPNFLAKSRHREAET